MYIFLLRLPSRFAALGFPEEPLPEAQVLRPLFCGRELTFLDVCHCSYPRARCARARGLRGGFGGLLVTQVAFPIASSGSRPEGRGFCAAALKSLLLFRRRPSLIASVCPGARKSLTTRTRVISPRVYLILLFRIVLSAVMRGLDPRIHDESSHNKRPKLWKGLMDCRSICVETALRALRITSTCPEYSTAA